MADEPEKEEGKGFKVQDKRRFTDEGEARDAGEVPQGGGDSETETTPVGAAVEGDGAASANAEAEQSGGHQSSELPPINFSTFLISLSTQALMLLGEIDDPATGKAQKDVAVAKQTIDIIAMLDEKSRGNLDPHEEQLMKEVLYNLRMRYVEAVRQK